MRWSWDQIAREVNRVQGGRKGVTGPTLYRYATGQSSPRNEMLKEYVLEAIDLILGVELYKHDSPENGRMHERAAQIRERNESHFQSLYLCSPVMMHSFERDGHLISVSHHWLEKTGYEWHEVIGRRFDHFLSEESPQSLDQSFYERLFQTGSCNDVVVKLLKKNGEVLDALLSATVATLPQSGANDIALAALIDVTGKRRESLELQFLQSLVENAPDTILTVSRTGVILSVNQVQPGFQKEEVVGSLVYEYIDSSHHETMRKALENVFNPGAASRFELLSYGQHGEPAWYESHVGPIKHQGQIIAASIITSNITERKKIEAQSRAVFEQNISGVFRISLSGRVLDCNHAFARILGYRYPKDLQQIEAANLFYDIADWERYKHSLKQKGIVHNFEVRHCRRDGTPIWVLINSSLLADETADQSVSLGTLVDISEKKRMEETLLRQNEYLRTLHETALGVLSHLDVDELLEAVVTRAGGLVGTPHGYIYVVEPEQTEMRVRVAVGEMRRHVGHPIQLGEGLGGQILQTGRPLAVKDYSSWAGRDPSPQFDHIHAVVGVPLKSGMKTIGVIALAHLESERVFDPEEVMILGQFAELASIALDNAQLYETAQYELSKREQLVEQMQENLGESLTALKIELERLSGILTNDDVTRRSLGDMRARLKKATDALKATTRSLSSNHGAATQKGH